MFLAVVLYTVHVILGEGEGIYPVCLAVALYTVHVILGVGRYISCLYGCCAVYSTCISF